MRNSIIILFLFLGQICFGRKIYVSSTLGNDSRTITQATSPSTPWASLSKVQSSMSSIVSGDSILFMCNNAFRGSLTVQSKTNVFFGNYGSGSLPLFTGTGSTISTLFILRNCSNVVFDGWRVIDTTISATDRYIQAKIQIVFKLESGCINNTIRNCTMERIGYGIYLTTTSSRTTINKCTISNLRMIKNTPRPINPDDDYGGVPIQISCSNNNVTENIFTECYATSYDYGYDGGGIEFFEEGVVIENNFIAYNTFNLNNGTMEFGSNRDSIANNLIRNNTFAYNRVTNCISLLYINNRGQYKTSVRNLMVYNNVFVQQPNSILGNSNVMSMAVAETTANIVISRNNIFKVGNGSPVCKSNIFTGTQMAHTNNLYQLSNGSRLNMPLNATEFSSALPIWVDTTNANAFLWNYNLLPNSLGRGNGTNVGLTRDFSGKAVVSPINMGILQ